MIMSNEIIYVKVSLIDASPQSLNWSLLYIRSKSLLSLSVLFGCNLQVRYIRRGSSVRTLSLFKESIWDLLLLCIFTSLIILLNQLFVIIIWIDFFRYLHLIFNIIRLAS